jgi:hopanoid C-3 methylase
MALTIYLIRPNPHKDSIGLQKFMICEPLELEYISAVLEQAGHTVTILDMLVESPKSILQKIFQNPPHLIGFTAYIPHVGQVLQHAKHIKSKLPQVPIIVGGVHAECNPGDFESPFIDYIVKCNALSTIPLLANAIATYQDPALIKSQIPGIWNGVQKKYELQTTWDAFPFPDRNKTQHYRHKYNYIFHEKCATIKTSFGCPYKCEFCYCIAITQNQYWARPIEEVVAEIQTIQEKNIFIVDDNFLVNISRIKTFCALLTQHQITKHFILFGRADFIVEHPDIIALLQQHGLKAIFVGIESFTEKELENYKKKTTVQMNTQAVHLLDTMGIECYSGIIAGTDWTRKDFDTLIQFLNQFKMPMINLQPITPIPGTPVYDNQKHEITEPRTEYQLWDMAHILLEPKNMSRRSFYWNMIRVYYKTSTGWKGHVYVLKNYGFKIYYRTITGILYLTWQYFKLLSKG